MITGGAGFIAFHLACRLQDEGHDVVLLDNFNSFYDPAIKRRNARDLQARGGARLFETDILDAGGLRHAFQESRPQAIVHLAAWAGVRPSLENPAIYAETNVTGTVHLLQLAREFDIESFIFGSSSSVYGGNEHVPFSEEDPVDRPVSPYAATKRAGELLCHTYALNYAMLQSLSIQEW
jgi:UDP-glucuronate 4-epimerase